MRPIFIAQLVNDPFGDPGLYLDFKFEKRALPFDLGELGALPARKLLRISDVFVSHTHMDHFAGFDRLLRVCLGRNVGMRFYGPGGFIDRVEHKLGAYTWNLVERYPTDFVIEAWEVEPDWHARGARFRCHRRFQREALDARRVPGGVLLDEPAFRVRAIFLHHGTACLAFAAEERAHINVWKNALAEPGLPVGPWLRELKRAVIEGAPVETPVCARWRDHYGAHERTMSLGELRTACCAWCPEKSYAT
jgi:ribonuclease Z